MNVPTHQHPDQELIDALLPKLRELQRRVHNGTVNLHTKQYDRVRSVMEQCLQEFANRTGQPNPPLS